MIEAKDITKMVKHITRRDKGKVDSNIMHPIREWALGLLVHGILVLCGVIFSIALYRVYHDSLETEVSIISTTIPFQPSLVADTIHWYENERESYEAMLGKSSFINVPFDTPVITTRVIASSSAPVLMEASTPTNVVPVERKKEAPASLTEIAVPAL